MNRIFEIIIEFVGWIQIVLSSILLGIIFGFIVYCIFPTIFGMICGILILCIGIVAGIVLATKKHKTTGTIDFLSKVSATPELDDLNKTEDDKGITDIKNKTKI